MNQKLRTARSGIVILFAVLCIVCLSLSLVFSAHFAAYAEEAETPTLNDENGLWLVHYEGNAEGERLWDGNHDGKYITYLDSVSAEDGSLIVKKGTDDDKDCFAPYRATALTLKLNPDYEINGTKLSSLYKLDAADYTDNVGGGEEHLDKSINMHTSVTAKAIDGVSDDFEAAKDWTIAVLCNEVVDAPKDYIGNGGNRGFATSANYTLLKPAMGNTVVYDVQSASGDGFIVAVQFDENGSESYWEVARLSDGGLSVSNNEFEYDVEALQNENISLINYLIRGLDAKVAEGDIKAYTLTITALDVPAEVGEIRYAQSSVKYDFNVTPQGLGNDDANDHTFENHFTFTKENSSVYYTDGSAWISEVGFKLFLKDSSVPLVEGKDYIITSQSNNVGPAELRITGQGNLSGWHTINGQVNIIPARNSWDKVPNIIGWTYGTYKAGNNLIVATPKFLDDPNDISFRIVRLVEKNGLIVEEAIEDLSNIHYFIENGTTNGIVTDDVIKVLETLDAGNYRLYASVYGASGSNTDRNYLEFVDNQGVDFTIFTGNNTWKAGEEPTILNGGWIEGKLTSTDGLINAASTLGKDEDTILIIYRLGENGKKDQPIYSNRDEDKGADNVSNDINVLKGLKAGRYYLLAEVEGTNNYTGLRTRVLFTVAPNNLPIWAVVLIVAGSLGLVALVFGILHQKGVLQMLTGKVIISMRTRANVDATLAAIRAAKVAREAEASIAAAKAREAEEGTTDKTEDK